MQFDPFSEEYYENPYEIYRWLREEAPVYHNEELGFWAVSRYDDCVEAHRDVTTYTSTRGLTLDQLRSAEFGSIVEQVNSMIMMDPPQHHRMRRLVSKAFTPRAIASWEPVVTDVISRTLDGLAERVTFDAVVDFAGPFPIEVIAEIVGVPKADRSTVRRWTDEMLEREVGNPFPTERGMLAGMSAGQYYLDLVRDRRTTMSDDTEHDTDMVGHLLAIEIVRDDGEVDHLADDEIASFIGLLTAAGAETVTKLVGNAIVTFAEWPDQLAVLRADPSVAPSAVEEMLRWRAPSQYQGRYSVADKDWHGVTIPAGQPLLIVTGAANRDPRAYDDPDRLDITRQAAPGITFGYGIHHCIGAHLARLEGRIAFTEMYRRWPNLEVDLDRIEYVRMTNVAGPSIVPIHAAAG